MSGDHFQCLDLLHSGDFAASRCALWLKLLAQVFVKFLESEPLDFHVASHLMSEHLTSNLLEVGDAESRSRSLSGYLWLQKVLFDKLILDDAGEKHLASCAASSRFKWSNSVALLLSCLPIRYLPCSLPEDGYIDKDELYFLLDRVGTFKKAKWSWSQFFVGNS